MQPIFEVIGGVPTPVLVDGPDGMTRDYDGIRFITAEQYASRFNLDVAAVENAYGNFVIEVMDFHSASAGSAGNVVRKMYERLDDDHFALFIKQCRRLAISPLSKGLWPSIRFNDKSGDHELTVELGADGFFTIANRSGDVLEYIGPHWCTDENYEWREVCPTHIPFAARFGVRRRGFEEPTWAVAKWESYAPFKIERGVKVINDFWMKMPDFMLGKVASCLAIRRAFNELFSGVYCREEMMQADNPTAPPPAPSSAPVATDADDLPQTSRQLELALIDIGLGRKVHRDEVIAGFKERWKPLYTQNIVKWHAEVFREVKRNPARYGIASEAVGA